MADKREEFVLETSIDLDDETARKKAKKFKDDYKDIKIKAEVQLGDSSKKFDALKNRITTVKNLFQDAFKIKQSTLSDIEKITSELTKLAQNLDNLKKQIKEVKEIEESTTKSSVANQTKVLTKYKTVQSAIDKITNKMKTGMDGDSFKNAANDLSKLEKELDDLKAKLDSKSLQKVELLDFKREKQKIVNLINNMDKLEEKGEAIQSSLKGIQFVSNTKSFDELQNSVESLLKLVDSNWEIDFDTRDAFNELEKLEIQLDNLKKTDKLKGEFDDIRESIQQAFGDTKVEQLKNLIDSLISETNRVDGSFESIFGTVNRILKQTQSEVKEVISNLSKVDNLTDKFENIKETLKEAFDDSVVGDLEQELENLRNQANKLDGSFEDSFKNVDNLIKQTHEDAKAFLKELQQSETYEQGKLINEYKSLSNVIDQIKKKVQSGLPGESLTKATKEIQTLETKLQDIETKLIDISKDKIKLFDATKSNKEIVDIISSMNKIETKVIELQSKSASIKFINSTKGFKDVLDWLDILKAEVNKSEWELDFKGIGEANVQLKNLESAFKRLQSIDKLRGTLESVREDIELAFDKNKVNTFISQIETLTTKVFDLDGSFEKSLNSLETELSNVSTEAKEVVSELSKMEKIEQDKLIKEYKALSDNITKIQEKLKFGNLDVDTKVILEDKLDVLENELEAIEKKILDINKHKIDLDATQTKKELNSLVDNLIKIDKRATKIRETLNNLISNPSNANSILKLSDMLDKFDLNKSLDMDFDIESSNLDKIEKAIDNLKDVDSLINKFKTLENSIRQAFGDVYADNLLNSIEQLNSETNILDKDFKVMFNNLKSDTEEAGRNANQIISDLSKVSTVENSFTKVREKIRQAFGDTVVDDFIDKIEQLKIAAQNMDADFSTLLDQFKLDLSETSTQASEVVSNLKKVDTLEGSFNALRSEIEEAFGIQAVIDFEAKLKDLGVEAKNLGGDFDKAYAEANTQLRRMQSQLKKTSTVIKTVNNFWNDFSSSLKAFTLGNVLGDMLTSSIYQIKDVFLELDQAMTDLKKVAETGDINTTDKLDAIQDKAMEVSKQVGMTTSETISGIASALQAGMGSMENSIEVAKNAMMLANVGDLSQDEASKGLNTIVNSFGIDPLKETNVQVGDMTQKTTELAAAMDKLNYASNTQAIDMQNLIQAFQGGGATLSNYGVEIGDATAMITAANTSLQNGSKVGNGMKSLAINLQGMKVNAKEGTLEFNKTAKALEEIAGIDVYSNKQTGEIKDVIALLDEIKAKWGSLKEDEQLGLAEAIAGELLPTQLNYLRRVENETRKKRKD